MKNRIKKIEKLLLKNKNKHFVLIVRAKTKEEIEKIKLDPKNENAIIIIDDI